MDNEHLASFAKGKELLLHAKDAISEAIETIEGAVVDILNAEMPAPPPVIDLAEPPKPLVIPPGAAIVWNAPNKSRWEMETEINDALKSHNTVAVSVNGDATGVRIGGNAVQLQEGQKVIFVGKAGSPDSIRGLELYPDAAGEVWLKDIGVCTVSAGDKAPVRVIDKAPNLHLKTHNVRLFSTYNGYQGFGMMWGMVLIDTKLTSTGYLLCEAAKEHGIYSMNMRHVDIAHIENATKLLPEYGEALGCGRTLFSHQNRCPEVTGYGTLSGPASSGSIIVRKSIARRCGHEGVLFGMKPQGGSDLTSGGHTGWEIAFLDHTSIEPFCGVIAVWMEASSKLATIGNPLGVRAWQLGGLSPAEGITYAAERLRIGKVTIDRDSVPEGRTPYLISGCRVVTIHEEEVDEVQKAEYDHQSEVPQIEILEFV